MADIRGIELASEIYGLEDTSARNTATAASQTATQAGQTATQASQTATQASQTATQADSKIGTLANLNTTAKTNLVAAINEVNGKIPIPTSMPTPTRGAAFSSGGFSVVKWGNLVQVNISNAALVEQAMDNILALSGLPEPKEPLFKNLSIIASQELQVCYLNPNGELRAVGGGVKNGTVYDSFTYISKE